MNDIEQKDILDTSWQLHSLVENAYREDLSVSGEDGWPEKQRLLLADMALHLLQTAINSGPIATDKLTNNIHAILTISDQFLPDAKLKEATKNLYRKLD